MPERPIVFFAEATDSGVSEPVFIIKATRQDGDYYYLTKVLWEYPPPGALPQDEPDRQEKLDAISAVVTLFDEAGPGLVAKEIEESVAGLTNGQAGGK